MHFFLHMNQNKEILNEYKNKSTPIQYLLCLFLCVWSGVHVAQASIKFNTKLRMTLNF